MNRSNIHVILRERLTWLFFLINDTDELDSIHRVTRLFKEVLDVFHMHTQQPLDYYEQLLYKIVLYSRDIQKGRGVRKMVYALIYEWFGYNKQQCYTLIRSLVYSSRKGESPYGCWRDLREIAMWTYEQTRDPKHLIIRYCIVLLNHRLSLDVREFVGMRHCSNVAKWIPRERGKWQWLFHALADHWALTHTPYLYYVDDDRTKNQRWMNYRKICSMLNLHNGTLEIGLCSKTVAVVPATSIGRKSVFKYGALWSREDVKERMINPTYTDTDKKNGFCGFHYYPGDLVNAVTKDRDPNTLNSLWIQTIRQFRYLHPNYRVLPILDTGMFFTSNAGVKNSAIGVALSLAEISDFGKRIMVMGHNPAWIRIPEDYTFVDSVQFVKQCISDNVNKNVDHTIGIIIQSFLSSKMTEEDIEQVCLVILSDMCFEEEGENDHVVSQGHIHNRIKTLFRINGITQMPHIVYWGFGSGSGSGSGSGFYPVLPCGFDEPRTTLIRGNSSSGVELVRYMNFKFGRELTPYLSMCRILGKTRYLIEDTIVSIA